MSTHFKHELLWLVTKILRLNINKHNINLNNSINFIRKIEKI
jgi:hypothetical protein